MLSTKTLDVGHRYNRRVEVWFGNTTASGFDAVFRTWVDRRIYVVTATWMAYGSR